MENKKEKKTENINSYMNTYIQKRYKENPVYWRMYKNTMNIKKKYEISDTIIEQYKHSLHHIVKMKEMISELPDGVFEKFLMEYKTLDFKKK